MRSLKFVVAAGAFLTGHLYASGIGCSYSGGSTTSSCYGAGVAFSANDTVNFLNAFGSASQSPTNVMTSGPLNGFSTNGVGVTVTLGGGGGTMPGGLVAPASGTSYISRVDDTQYVWSGNVASWDSPGDTGVANTPSFMHYAGQFVAPTQETQMTEAQGGWGTYLLGPTASNGSAAGSPLAFYFNQGVAGVGFNISTVSNGAANTNFVAEIDAFNGGNLLGSYYLIANGLGGYCATVESFLNDPTSCSDAPFIGFSAASNSITKITIDAIDSTGNFGFFLANMVLQEDAPPETPEPALFVLTGGGLVLLGYWERKRHANRG